MRYFLDTEFIESGAHKPIELISIGIVSDDGREYYAVSSEFNESDANPWVRDNVLPQIGDSVRKSLGEIAAEVYTFCGAGAKVEFWGYYSDYDWVVFCQMFGSMVNLPKGFPMYCRDIKQLCDEKGNPKLPQQGKGEHNAVADARWNRIAHRFLTESI